MGSSAHSALVFKVNKLGDNIVFLPVIQRLAEERIFDRLTLWNTPLAVPLYQPLRPHVRLEITTREAFYPAWKNPAKLLALTRKVRSARPDIALVAEDMGNTAYFLALASGAPRRLGIRPPYLKIPFAINEAVSLEREAPSAVKSWNLGRALAAAAGAPAWPMNPPPPDLSHLIRDSAVPFDVLFHAGASTDYQRWPIERHADLAGRLSQNLRVGWFDIPALPQPVLDSRVKVIRSQELDVLVSHIARAGVFVGNNSGPMNIASALGTPSVILMGPTSRPWDPYWHPSRFRILRDEKLPCICCDPPGLPIRQFCTNRVHPMACMDHWRVETVEEEVLSWHRQWAPPS